MQMEQEIPVGVQLARDAELHHDLVGRDAVNEETAQVVAVDLAIVDQLGDEVDRPHLAHERGVEADLVDAVEDLGRAARQLLALERVDVDDDDIATLAAVDQREDCRIAHIATVPIMLAINLDGLKHEGQATRGKNAIGTDLMTLEDPDLAGPHVGRREVELYGAVALPQRLEIDAALEHVLQRVAVQGIEFIG